MKTRVNFILLITALMILTASCDKSIFPVRGNGDVVTETRDVYDFKRVDNEGQFDVYIIQDEESSVRIEAESNLIGRIRTRVNGSTLEIDSKDNLKPSRPMKLYIHTPDVNGVSLSGSGIIDLGSITTDDLSVKLSGSGEIRGDIEAVNVNMGISGSGSANIDLVCDYLETSVSGSGEMYFNGSGNIAEFDISGSGSIQGYNFPVNECYTKISGSGNMYLNVEERLDVKISGSGSIYYIGNPAINTNISGSGNLINRN